jgi:hypothetical protein
MTVSIKCFPLPAGRCKLIFTLAKVILLNRESVTQLLKLVTLFTHFKIKTNPASSRG